MTFLDYYYVFSDLCAIGFGFCLGLLWNLKQKEKRK